MVFTMAGTLVGSIDVGEGRSVRAVRTLLFDDITCTHSAKAKIEIGIEIEFEQMYYVKKLLNLQVQSFRSKLKW